MAAPKRKRAPADARHPAGEVAGAGGAPIAPAHPALAISLILAVSLGVLLALHGHVLRYPFLEDDYIFITEARRGPWGSLAHAFIGVADYFRPLGREIYFGSLLAVAGQSPLVFHVVNLGLLLALLLAVALVGRRLGGLRVGLLAASFLALSYPHRVLLGYVSCAQDLLATGLACAAVLAHVKGHRRAGAVVYLLAVLAKESVAPLPLVLALWESWSHRGKKARWVAALRATGPLWVAAGAWLVLVPVLRSWVAAPEVRGAAFPGAGIGVTTGGLLTGLRGTLLALVGLEQPWRALRPAWSAVLRPSSGAALAAVLAAALPLLAFASTRDLGAAAPKRGTPGAAPDLARLAVVWTLVMAVPPALLGPRFNAYYVNVPAVGFAWLVGSALARWSPGGAALVFVLGVAANVAANGTSVYRSSPDDPHPEPGVSATSAPRLEWEVAYVRALRSQLLANRPPRGAAIYLSQPFGFLGMGTSAARAPRLWLGDPTLDLIWANAGRPVADARPRVFLRFNPEPTSFTPLPDSLVFASYDGLDALGRGRVPEAREALERAVRWSRRGPYTQELGISLVNLGVACMQMGDTAAARAAWSEASRFVSGRGTATVGLATLDQARGRYDAARQWLLTGLAQDPGDVRMLHSLSYVERLAGRAAEADEAWRRVTALDPRYADSVLRAPQRR